jgi:peptidyl-tRNA hydrolase, PTH1 family
MAAPAPEMPDASETPTRADAERAHWTQAVVGFGNPAEKYRDSPHNVGREVVDLLARFFDAEWTAQPEALVATVEFSGGTLHLIKPRTNVNDTGPALKALSDRLGFGATDCVLVHDDLSFDPGVVRARDRGNDGGHNGVRSVLAAFDDIAIRRVKIGVGRPPGDTPAAEHVLAPMSLDRLAVMRDAYATAAHRVLTSLATPEAAHAELLEARTRYEKSRSDQEQVATGGDQRAAD